MTRKDGIIQNQSYFVQHEPCPKCHSRDNLGRWSDGHAHCFGCGYYEVGVRSLQMMGVNDVNSDVEGTRQSGVEQFTRELPTDAYRWIKKYGITDEEISTHSIVWLPNRESLAFGFEPESGKYYTRRYFGRNPNHPKYIHSKHKDFVVFDSTLSVQRMAKLDSCLVFAEDCISAIKVSRVVSASPVFGSSVGLERFKRASKLFKRTGVWLDRDMYQKAVLEAIKANSVGFNCAGAILGPKDDPKDHSTEEIRELISGLFHV